MFIPSVFIWASTLASTLTKNSQQYFDRLQISDTQFENHENIPGFDLDLNALRLVKFSLADEPVWLTERQKLKIKALGGSFMDITDTPNLGLRSKKQQFTYPKYPNSSIVSSILPLLSTEGPKANLAHFTSFHTRYYNSDSGKASSEWLLSLIRNYTEELGTDELKAIVSVQPFQHKWKQTSVIVRIAPNGTTDSSPVVIVGAHCDSLNKFNPFLRAPGADDDGSGSITILEAYRVLLVSGYTPQTPLEFHWYAAEEGGLLGSQAIASHYEENDVVVKGMLQFDMTAWVKAGSTPVIGLITNQVDDALTEFQSRLVDSHLSIPYSLTKYPMNAGSDHMSWTQAGYQSAQAFESTWENANNLNVHSPSDKIYDSDEFSFEHIVEFSKLAVAYAVELSS